MYYRLLSDLAFCRLVAATGSASGRETALEIAPVFRIRSARVRTGDNRRSSYWLSTVRCVFLTRGSLLVTAAFE